MNWLDCLHTMLDIISTRISNLRNEYKEKSGVIVRVEQQMRLLYNSSASFRVQAIEEDNDCYSVTPQQRHDGKRVNSHMVQIDLEHCSCGLWQEHEIPCIHAVSYFRMTKDTTLQQYSMRKYQRYILKSLYKIYIKTILIQLSLIDKVT